MTITGCKLSAAGTSAVWVEHSAQRVVVADSSISHVGFVGVRFDGWDEGGGDKPIPGTYAFKSPAAADVNYGHSVRNNLIFDVGRHVTNGAAVYVHQSHDVTVENNLMSRSPRNLMSTFGIAYGYTSGGIGPFGQMAFKPPSVDKPPVVYGTTLDFFSQYEVDTSNSVRFRYNDVSHSCLDSQDCGAWEAWGPGKDNEVSFNRCVKYTVGSR